MALITKVSLVVVIELYLNHILFIVAEDIIKSAINYIHLGNNKIEIFDVVFTSNIIIFILQGF